jgi:hypothetical protein
MTGESLRQLLLQKWGYSYDLQVRRISNSTKIHIQVMWRYLEQASFPLTETEYLQHLETIANHLLAWGIEAQFSQFIINAKHRPRLGKPVVLALDLSVDMGERSVEWLV